MQGFRNAGVTTYKAAQSKNQDNIVMAAYVLTTAYANCHVKYAKSRNLQTAISSTDSRGQFETTNWQMPDRGAVRWPGPFGFMVEQITRSRGFERILELEDYL